jgi:hypothetical protein
MNKINPTGTLTSVFNGIYLCIIPLLRLRTHPCCRILQIEHVQLRVLTHRRNLADVMGGWVCEIDDGYKKLEFMKESL